jgi:hypothetical protein
MLFQLETTKLVHYHLNIISVRDKFIVIEFLKHSEGKLFILKIKIQRR